MGSDLQLTPEERERLENRDRRCHYGIDCGHTWAWSRGEVCPECRLLATLRAAETERDQLRAAIADLRHGFRQKEVWGSVWGALNAVSHDHAGIKPSRSGAKRIVGALLPVIDNVLQHYLAPETISAIALEARQVNEMRYRLSGAEYHRREAEEKLTAAEAERDQARRELVLQQGSFAAVVAERDAALARQNRLECLLETVTLKHQDALGRATRLAALAQAAREIGDKGTYNEDCPCEECCAFEQAYHALAAPPGEEA